MATFYIEQFGCRATQADAAAIERQLLARGYQGSPDAISADVIVVNTCTVTAAADTQARHAIHAIQRTNPAARIVVTGCYAQRAPEELAALPGVAWVVGNLHKPEIPRLIDEMAEMAPKSFGRSETGFVPLAGIAGADSVSRGPLRVLTGNIQEQKEFPLFESVSPPALVPLGGGPAGHTRPILKIQDGCDSRCSYCVIPQVRGRSRSLAPDLAIGEITRLVESGAREIVLSGIDLGSYGRDLYPQTELGHLLRRVLEETTLERVRVSSIEPMDVTGDLIALFATSDRLARHFHMPLQSGSDKILAMMHRWYRAEHYARRAELIRENLPDAAIGADVIAGFPGETEEDYRATLELLERLPLSYVHVFSFSPRPGTRAAGIPEHVPQNVIDRRARELRALGERKKLAFCSGHAGRTMRVLTLNRSGKSTVGPLKRPWTRAISTNYLDVRVAGAWQANQFLDVRIESAADGHLAGIALQ